jgi:multimeric flavodoxin WrbA
MTESDKKIDVLVLLGSPRKEGNSAILAGEIIKGAEFQGANVECIYINGMDIKPCQSCYACQKKDSKGCAVKDDMQQIYPKLIEADSWIIASPVYWFTMSAQTKLWMDRCFALLSYGENAFKKKIAIAMSYGDTDPFNSGCINALRAFQDSFRYVGAKIVGMVYGSAMASGEIRENSELLQQAEALGRKLVK